MKPIARRSGRCALPASNFPPRYNIAPTDQIPIVRVDPPPKDISEIRALAREHRTEAIETLVAVMRDGSTSAAARVSAANALLDRGYGKPTQVLEGNLNGPVRELSDQELALIAGGAFETEGETP